MDCETRLKVLKIEYKSKLTNMEYLLSLEERETEQDLDYIFRLRSNILLVKEFLDDLNAESS